MTKKILFLSGSSRKGSFNTQLAKAACEIAKSQGADAEFVDLIDYELPLFNQDEEDERGIPGNAKRLKHKFVDADGFFIAAPEYNGSITPLLKNTLDWLSRAMIENEAPLTAYADKAAAISGASPGGLGGIRGLVPLRLLLSNLGVNMVGQQLALGSAHDAFDEKGMLKSERYQTMLEGIVTTLIRIS